MSTGENEQALRKIIDMTRWIAIIILLLHFYYYLYHYFSSIGLSWSFTDKILNNILKAGLFSSFHKSKLIALFFLVLSLVGVKGKKSEKIQDKLVATYIFTGLLLYFIGYFLFKLYLPLGILTWAYISITFAGIILLITGGTYLSRIIRDALSDDIFNEENETFPQEERLIVHEFS